jgi:hypothetical protein
VLEYLLSLHGGLREAVGPDGNRGSIDTWRDVQQHVPAGHRTPETALEPARRTNTARGGWLGRNRLAAATLRAT